MSFVALRNSTCLLAVTVLFSACGTSDEVEGLRSEVVEVGDTLVVTSSGDYERVRIDDVQVVWRSDELANPTAMIALDDRLIVADLSRLHLLLLSDSVVHTTSGREGDGPGEYRNIRALGRTGSDTVLVYDVRVNRTSFLNNGLEYLGSTPTIPVMPYVNPVRGSSVLAMVGGGVVSMWSENGQIDRPTRTALTWRNLEADTVRVLEEWDGIWLTLLKQFGFVTNRELFGPEFVGAISGDGLVAWGDGVDYCVHVQRWNGQDVQRLCRDREPIPVGHNIRNVSFDVVEDPDRRERMTALAREQKIPDHIRSYDGLLFDEEGRLWVRTLGPELADVHPYLLNAVPELRPSHREWDVFDEGGSLIAGLELPGRFRPAAITSDQIYGFLELSTGEITIGSVALPF